MINSLKILFLGLFCLCSLLKISYSAQQITGEIGVRTSLRVCADPNNLPYSNQNEEGYENKIADLFAKKLGNKTPLQKMVFPIKKSVCNLYS